MSSRLLRVEDWEKLAAEFKFDLDAMVVSGGVSLRQLERFFKLKFGQRPTAWMGELKCRRAAELIGRGYRTDEAARETGFASASHLCHEFKKAYGVPPQSFAPGVRGRQMSL